MNHYLSEQFEKWTRNNSHLPTDLDEWNKSLNELEVLWENLELENNRLKITASLDPLTGILNFESFKEAFKKSLIDHEKLALILIDIDDFKSINSRYGHLSGNHLLSSFSNLLKQEIPISGLLSRFGGDEFFIAFPCDNSLVAKSYCVLLLEKIRQSIFNVSNTRIALEVSIGITLANRYQSLDTAFQRADRSLLQAKNLGKNRYHFKSDEEIARQYEIRFN